MPTTRRNTRKRVKEEADDDNDDAASQAQNQPGAASSSATTATANKKRKLERSPSLPASSSSLIITDAPATMPDPHPTAGPSSRKRRAKRQESGSAAPVPAAAAARKRSRVKKEESVQPDELLNGSANAGGAPIDPANNNNDDKDNIKLEEETEPDQPETTVVKMEQDNESDKENDNGQESTQTKRLTAKEKGKARAIDPPEPTPEVKAENASHSHSHDHAKLQEELARLRSELQSATATLETQSAALNAVTSAFSCNVCLESLQNPLGLACGHVFCQDDLWNWFHRISEDSDDNSHDEDDEDDDDSMISGSDSGSNSDDSISDGLSASDSSSVVIQHPLNVPGRHNRTGTIGPVRRYAPPAMSFAERRRRGQDRERERARTLIQIEDDYNTSDDDEEDGDIRYAGPRIIRPGARPVPRAAPAPRAAPQMLIAEDGRPILINAPARANITNNNNNNNANEAEPPHRRRARPTEAARIALADRAGPLQNISNHRSAISFFDSNPNEAGPSSRRPRGRVDEPISVPDTDEGTARRAASARSEGAPTTGIAREPEAEPVAGPSNTTTVATVPAAAAAEATTNPATAAAAATPGPASRRIPARKHPNRRNLTCPQCRVKIVIPPFPIFIIRELANVIRAHDAGRRQASMEREDERDTMNDPTWGGLFPRNASAGTSRAARPGVVIPARERDPTHQELMQVYLGEGDEDAQHRVRHVTGGRLESIGHFAEVGLGNAEARFRTGEEQRQDNEYDRLVLRFRQRQLEHVQADIDMARRTRRSAAAGRPRSAAGDHQEARIRGVEATRIRQIEDAVQEARRNAARHGADRHRGRDVLARGMRDADDGVRRCIDCGWEIENARCEHCGVNYDSDSEFDDNGEDVGGTSSPPRVGFVQDEDEDDLSDIVVPDSENAQANQSQAYEDEDEDADETDSEMETGGEIARPLRGTARLHPFSSEEEDNEDNSENEEEEGEDLFGDSDILATDDTVDNPPLYNDDDEEEEDQDETESEAAPSRGRNTAQTRRKRTQFLYDSEDDEDELADEEEEERQAGFIDDNVVVTAIASQNDDEDEESEAESTDRESRHAQKEQRRVAREAAAVSRQTGNNGRDSESEFTGSESPSTSDDDEDGEEDGEDQSLPTSVTSPPSKHEDEDDDDEVEEIASQDFLRQNRPRNGLTPAQAAARAAMARQQQNNRAITDVFNRIVNDKQKKAAAMQQQHAGPSRRQGNAIASTSQLPSTYKKRVIEESDEE